MATALYRKYRPLTFSDVIGQGHIVQTLSNAILHNRIGHAYLFTGPRGTGKTTMARIFARAVNCKNPKGADPCLSCDICQNITEGKSLDIFEIDAASNTGVDNIRELRENVKFPPSQAKFKVYIIDEVHMLSSGAFNALLKTLEEPPAHVIFILATTEIHKVPETIISRCQRFDFTRLSLDHIIQKISTIAANEKVTIDKEAIEMIALSAEGGMRDAESLFSQVISLEDKKITAKEVEEILGTTKRESIEAMSKALLEKDAAAGISLVNQLAQDGYDLDIFNKALLNHLRQIMLVAVDEKLAKIFAFELTQEQAASLAQKAKGLNPKEVLFSIGCFTEIQGKIKSAFIPQLPLEMAIVKAVQGPQAVPVSQNPAPAAPQAPQPRPVQPAPTFAPQAPLTPEKAPILPAEPKSDVSAPPISPAPETPKRPIPAAPLPPTEDLTPISGADFSLADVKKAWPQIIVQLKPLNHSVSAVLQSCQPVKAEGGIVTIAAKFGFHRDKLNENTNKLTMEGVFAKILGSQMRIKTITAEEAGITIASSLNQPTHSGGGEIPPSETSSLLSDAASIMGGRVVE